MADAIDSLFIEIDTSSNNANIALDKLADSLLKIDNRLRGVKVGEFSKNMNTLKKSVNGFTGAKNLDTAVTALRKLSNINAEKMLNAAIGVTEISNALRKLSGITIPSFEGLDNLINSMGKFGGKSMGSAVQNLPQLSSYLAQFVNSMNGVGALNFDMTGLTNLISSIAKLGGTKATQAAVNLSPISAQLQNFVRQMNNIGSVKFDMTGLTELVSSISKLGGKASTNAIPNIQALGTALKQLMTTLSTAPKVSSNVIQMTNALAKLASQGAKTGTATRGLSKIFDNFSLSATSARKHSLSFASALGKLYAEFWTLRRAFNIFKKAIDISSDLTEIQNVVDVTFGNMAYKVEEFAKTSIEQFGMSELALKQYASRFQAMGSAMGIDSGLISKANSFLNEQTDGYIGLSDSMSDVSLNLTKLTADMASFYNVEQDAVAEDLESIFTGQTRPLRTYGLDLTQATLQEWAMKQGLDADIQSMSQAEKTMLRYQYVLANTGAAQGDFARTSDTWANQVRILKQNFEQLGAIVGGVAINAFKPFLRALNTVMQKVISFAKTIADALGRIFGWTLEVNSGGITDDLGSVESSLEDAGAGADGLAGGLGSAADNAKNLKDTLSELNIDQLHKLSSTPDASSGSGGGSGSGGSGSGSGGGASMNLVRTESLFDKYKSQIDTLYELGEYVGETLTKAMNSINWDSVYQGARNFGTGLADFLNGLISPELFGAVGRTIAGALNTAIYAALAFGEEFDWYDLGNSIAEGINEFFRTFDFEALAETLNTWVDGLEETIKGFLQNLDWKDILSGIGEFLTTLDSDTIAVMIGVTAIKKFGENIASAIKGSLSPIRIAGIALTFSSFLTTVSGAGTVKDTVLSTLEAGMGTFMMTGNIKLSLIASIVSVFVNLAVKAGNWFGKKLAEWILNKNGEDGSQVWEMEDISISQAIGFRFNITDEQKEALHDKMEELLGNAGLSGLLPGFDLAMGNGGAIGEDIKNSFVTGLSDFAEEMKECFPIKENLQEAWDGFKEYAEGRKLEMSASISLVKKGWKTLTKFVGNAVKVAISLLKDGWKKLTEFVGTAVTVAISLAKKAWSSISKFVGTAVNVAISLFKKAWSTISGFVGTAVSVAISLWKKAWSSISGFIGTAVSVGVSLWKNGWKSISSWIGTTVSVGVNLIKTGWSNFKGWLGLSTGGIYTNGRWQSIRGYASGGNPQSARLFYANENGIPELIGRIGSNTAVMNNGQIVASVAAGVYQAVAAAFSSLQSYFASMTMSLRSIPWSVDNLAYNFSERFSSVSPDKAVCTIDANAMTTYNEQLAADISPAVQAAVFNGMMMAYASQNGNPGGKTVEIPIYLDGKEISRTVLDYQKMQNKRYILEPSFA